MNRLFLLFLSLQIQIISPALTNLVHVNEPIVSNINDDYKYKTSRIKDCLQAIEWAQREIEGGVVVLAYDQSAKYAGYYVIESLDHLYLYNGSCMSPLFVVIGNLYRHDCLYSEPRFRTGSREVNNALEEMEADS